MRTVLCCGVFDLAHAGHVEHLKEARSFGDSLIVALTLDEHVCKPGRPILKWEWRAAILAEMRCVDDVIASRNSIEAIHALRPAVYAKGSDYVAKGLLPEELSACEYVGAQIRFTKEHHPTTTGIIERIRQCEFA